jgi:hypothetical protein
LDAGEDVVDVDIGEFFFQGPLVAVFSLASLSLASSVLVVI